MPVDRAVPPDDSRHDPARPRHDVFTRLPMVDWYDPHQLLRTGLQVLVWGFVGQGRAMEESARSSDIPSFGGDEVWFDFVADVGDGWNPTFAIASLLAEEQLPVAGRVLPRGAFLLLGGDEVYPVPTQRNYRERFVGPYSAALPASDRRPRDARPVMFAIPGNHDWYDGLVSFTRLFTQYRDIGLWRTVQGQSYFALKLPQRWWLWAMDVLPESLMDFGQREYFRHAAASLERGDRVILVAAQPDWAERRLRYADESHFWTVEKELIEPRGATVHLWLSGDLHHYRRHERREPDGTTNPHFQRITSGGGGAFLYPTHRPPKQSVVVGDQEFVRKAAFPSSVTSFRLSLVNVAFAVKNWKLGIFPAGVLYWLMTWAEIPAEWIDLFRSPGNLLWLFTMLGVFVIFADHERRGFQWAGGLTHGLAQIVTAAVVTGGINRTFLGGGISVTDYIAAGVLNFAAGMIVAPTILGLYLMLALNVFGFHAEEAFSSLRVEDYKHFLRLHITPSGAVEIFPIAIARVPRRNHGRARYHLIESPLVIDPRRANPAAPETRPGEPSRR